MVDIEDAKDQVIHFMNYYYPGATHEHRIEVLEEDDSYFYFDLRENALALEMNEAKGSVLLQFEMLLAALGWWWEVVSFELMAISPQPDPCKRIRDTWQTN